MAKKSSTMENMAMKYNDILFDFDGVIFDTSKGVLNALKETLAQYQLPYNLADLENTIGLSAKKMLQKCLKVDNANIDEMALTFREIYQSKYLLDCQMYDGMLELLQELKDKGHTLHIVSLKPAAFIEKILHTYQINHYFNQKIMPSFTSLEANKTTMIKTLVPKITKAVMIGDLPSDIIAGNAINIPTIAVLYGYGTKAQLALEKPTHFVENVKELRKVLLYEN